ncbi:MAG: dephospho-CoA kinase [Bdellovibrionales bacterium GWA2_49_15]|nr:MAG: dephospho-CoA kinase [Bdellovibrionales bacterium GWA2_49_15]
MIGLTGGIASGKSTASRYLEEMGCSVICADKLVKEIYREEATILQIADLAPTVIADGKIDFVRLRALVFQNPPIKQKVEAIIYAKLPQYFQAKVRTLPETFVVYDVPLLFEKNLAQLCDLTVCAYCSPQTQKERLIKRDSISAELADKMIQAQMSLDLKKDMADFVIMTVSSHAELKNQLRAFLDKITILE